ncbi:Uma2 family endonuclease [Thiohalocapsa marina]|uniref:Uma2 family endonuclease n=2 Tax=Thiohalocapsa marina TaxID=424902 RepID=A0A5M8FTE0_9GAMM|nr:Uma2 family endonuclease [Thiohalocapsa marina]
MNLPLDVETYLQGELESEIRHEYVAGEVFAMGGAAEAHNRISLNLAFHLRAASRGTPCGVFISDMKVRVQEHDAFYYPDVLLTCDPHDAHPLYKTSPCLLVEVLSASTEVRDRREKLLAYRSLASLRDYLLVAQDQRRVERYRHREDGDWVYEVFEAGTLHLGCDALAVDISMDDIYEDVVFET